MTATTIVSDVWRYSTTVGIVMPGDGYLGSDTPTTTLCVSVLTWNALNVQASLMATQAGDAVLIQKQAAADQWANYRVTAAPVLHSDAQAWVELPVEVTDSSATPPGKHDDLLVTVVHPASSSAHSYATVDELAAALRVQVTVKNQDWLQSCLDASALEIDHALDRLALDPLPTPAPALVVQVNVARGVEWYKASDAAFGGVGFADTGILTVPGDTFARHAQALIPLTQQFGVA